MENKKKLSEEELAREIALDAKIQIKEARLFLKTFKNIVINHLKKEKPVHLVGFGTFSVFDRKPRKGVNPWMAKKGEVVIEDRKGIKIAKFKSGFKLKRILKIISN